MRTLFVAVFSVLLVFAFFELLDGAASKRSLAPLTGLVDKAANTACSNYPSAEEARDDLPRLGFIRRLYLKKPLPFDVVCAYATLSDSIDEPLKALLSAIAGTPGSSSVVFYLYNTTDKANPKVTGPIIKNYTYVETTNPTKAITITTSDLSNIIQIILSGIDLSLVLTSTVVKVKRDGVGNIVAYGLVSCALDNTAQAGNCTMNGAFICTVARDTDESVVNELETELNDDPYFFGNCFKYVDQSPENCTGKP